MPTAISDQPSVLVTGASRGIGKAIATRLARDGYRTMLVARSAAELGAVIDGLSNPSLNHLGVAADLQTPGGRDAVLAATSDALPDCVVHNLGGSGGVTDFWAPIENYESVWELNVGIAHELNRVLAPQMVVRGKGRLIFVSTLAVRLAKGNAPYVVAKAGLDAYVRLIARELKDSGVVAAGVRPGAVRVPNRFLANIETSDPEQFQRWLRENNSGVQMADPSEIASVVAFLCSSDSSYLSGSIIDADGGV